MAAKDPEVIDIPDEGDEGDFPEAGPQNPVEAKSYMDKLDNIFSTMDDLLQDDRKDMLHIMVVALKRVMAKHLKQMLEANIDLVLKAIHDLSCVYLRQHLTPEGAEVMEPTTDILIALEFLRQLPERKRKQEVHELITTAFDHLSETHAHISSYAANMSLLAKIADPETFNAVLKVTSRPLIQINIPEQFLSPVSKPKLKTTAEE